MSLKTENFSMFLPITKVDATQRLVYAIATAEQPDKAGEICDYATTKPNYEKWSNDFKTATDGKSLGNVRAMHGNVAVGKLTDLVFNDDAKQIEVCLKVVDDNEWKKVQEGVYTGVSQGGAYAGRWKDQENAKLMRYTAVPSEISLVDNPCLPSATFQMIKADGVIEEKHFTSVIVEKKADDIQVGPEITDAAKVTAADLSKEALEAEEQVWVSKLLPGQVFKTKPEMRAALIKSEADSKAKELTAPITKAVDDLKVLLDAKDGGAASATFKPEKALRTKAGISKTIWKVAKLTAAKFPEDANVKKFNELVASVKTQADVDALTQPAVEMFKNITVAEIIKVWPAANGDVLEDASLDIFKRDFTDDERKKLASEGKAMKDGSYPIATKGDLKNAISAYGLAKNEVGSVKNKVAAKRHIIARAKSLGATSMLPEGWVGKTERGEELAKGASLYGVANLLQLLGAVASAEDDLEYPSTYGTNVDKSVCDRFGSLVVELGDIAAEVLDAILTDMKDEESEEAQGTAMMMNAVKALSLVKAGARHSKGDQKLVQSIHDQASSLGADCSDMDKSVHGEGEALAKITAEKDALIKSLAGLPELIKDMGERVKRIEMQPAIIPPHSGLIVGKNGAVINHEGSHGGDASGLLTKKIEDFTEADSETLAKLAIKLSQRSPVQVR